MPRNLVDPRFLILETSGRVGQVAIAEGDQLGEVRRLDETRRHGRDLAPTVLALCAARNWKVRDLDAVIANIGPGSYTGLRVGLMSAKVLCYAAGCTFLGIETFAAVAHQAPAGVDHLAVIADAQQQQVYAQRWSRAGGTWSAQTRLSIEPFANWYASLDENVSVSGPAVRIFGERMTPRNPAIAADLCDPQPLSLLRLGIDRWRAGESDDAWTAEPLYLRPSNAEENWDKRQRAPG